MSGLYIRNTRIGGPSSCYIRHARYLGISGFPVFVVSDVAKILILSVEYKAIPPPPVFLSWRRILYPNMINRLSITVGSRFSQLLNKLYMPLHMCLSLSPLRTKNFTALYLPDVFVPYTFSYVLKY